MTDCYVLPISSGNLLHIEPYHVRKPRGMSIRIHGYVWGRHVGKANKETPDDVLQILIVAQSIALPCMSRNTNKKQGVDLDIELLQPQKWISREKLKTRLGSKRGGVFTILEICLVHKSKSDP
jgi:hypothetical protein